MLKILCFILFIISTREWLQAQESSTTSQQAVQQIVKNIFESLSNRDSISLKIIALLMFCFEYGMIWNLDTLIRKAIIQNTTPDFNRINTFDFINTTKEIQGGLLTL